MGFCALRHRGSTASVVGGIRTGGLGGHLITIFSSQDGHLQRREGGEGIGATDVWIDLIRPTRAETLMLEEALGIAIPTREEAQEIEASSRIYVEDDVMFMTANLLHQPDQAHPTVAAHGGAVGEAALSDSKGFVMPVVSPTTFILGKSRLITVRYEDLRSFHSFQARSARKDSGCTSAASTLVVLLETIIDRESDRIERIISDVERLSHAIFGKRSGTTARPKSFEEIISLIGKEGELISREHECLHSLDRVLTYLNQALNGPHKEAGLPPRRETAHPDLSPLMHPTHPPPAKVQFFFDATLGLINIQQNNIIKLFSVAAVALMPPTLIASIYGMNFKYMPELEWTYGYPLSLIAMVVAAVVPFTYFKRKGWF